MRRRTFKRSTQNTKRGWQSEGDVQLPKDVELVRVLTTSNLGRYLFAKSLLDRDGIEYMVKGDAIRMAHGWTPTGWLVDTALDPVEFWVRSEDSERARLLLRDLNLQMPSSGRDSNGDA
jgi:Putative prokaryotic signal transducing protein